MLSTFVAYQKAKTFPLLCKRLKLPEYLRNQLLRASASVALNLAEGSGKFTPADQRRYYRIAHGSVRECEAAIDLSELNDPSLRKLLDELAAMTLSLSRESRRSDAGKDTTADTDQNTDADMFTDVRTLDPGPRK